MKDPKEVIAELRHKSGSFYSVRIRLKEGEDPGIDTNDIFCEALQKYVDGTYQYQHTESFNPDVAKSILEETRRVLEHPDYDSVNNLIGKLKSTIDNYAIETGNPEETSDAIKKFKDEIFKNN